jgi:selenocysteine lyase/cysteine desulfurase
MIPCQRHLFDIPRDVAYLNAAYITPLPRASLDAGRDGLARKSRPWGLSPSDFFTESESARSAFARLINASPDDIAIVPAASYGIATAAANIDLRPGDRIIVLQDQFPSNVYAWTERARMHGAVVTTVATPEDGDWTTAIAACIDDRTAVVAVPHCLWTDGGLIDLSRIGRLCRGAAAALVVDATQSLGVLPLDISEVQPDFLVAATYKWLLGPYSLGFLYAAPHRHDGRPIEHNWIAREGSEDFAGLVRYRDGFQPGARRYDVGERSNFALMPAALRSLELIGEWTPERTAATLRSMTERIADRATALGLVTLPSHRRAGHFLGLRFPEGLPDALTDRLAGAGVHASVRGTTLRVTPHLYNDQEDVERLFGVLETIR